MEDNMPTRDIIAENQTAAAISKLRRGEADDALRDEVQAATLSTMQKMLEELAGLKSGMWSKNDLKTLIDETTNWPDHLRPAACSALLSAIRQQIKIKPCTQLAFDVLGALVRDPNMNSSELNKFFAN